MIRLPLLPLLPLLFLLSPGFGKASAQETRPNNMVTVSEGDGALLPCDLSSENTVRRATFDWRKDGKEEKKEVFMYKNGSYYGQGLLGQNEQFIGRVEFFKDEVASGNASIKIKNTRLEDSGTYTCSVILFPVTSVVNIILNVVGVLKMRKVSGAAREPYVKQINITEKWWLLQCKVQGVPKPEVEWRDSAGEVLSVKDLNSKDALDHFSVELYVNVTKSDIYNCVATQRSIYHQINSTLIVYIKEKELDQDSATKSVAVPVIGALLFLVMLAIFIGVLFYCTHKKKRSDQQPEPDSRHMNGANSAIPLTSHSSQ